MWRPSAWPMANAASRLTASISRHCAPVACRTVWFSCRRGLALCTKIETLPSLPIASSAARRAPSSGDRSQRSSAPSRSAPSTRAPSAASASAMPRPMPRAEPVTSAVSPSRSLADMRADRILARVEVLQEEVAAGALDIVHHAGRGVHHALPAHEADAASLVDRERAVRRKILLQRRLHGALDLICTGLSRAIVHYGNGTESAECR